MRPLCVRPLAAILRNRHTRRDVCMYVIHICCLVSAMRRAKSSEYVLSVDCAHVKNA
jgi:hypothetical protein